MKFIDCTSIQCWIRCLILAGFFLPVVSWAVDFEKDLKPALEAKCLSCHNPNNAKGDLSLDRPNDSWLEVLKKGDAEGSRVYKVTVPGKDGSAPEMPEKGDPLTDQERLYLKQWIDGGADWPDGLVLREASKTDDSWWAYQPLMSDSDLSQTAANSPSGNPVDAFIKKRLLEKGLSMNGHADRRTLIRRATYDLTGLPPSAEEVAAFVGDDSPRAYERLIDQLLASPRYGERWGRHWLDVVRFGESNGFERNVLISDLWPFRDYVIDSINADKPFDQFIGEHVAGDVIAPDKPESVIGSAFLVAGPYDDVGNQDAVQAAQIRANTLDEIINATGQAFLGMTIGCARCHDHKFDPIRTEDYYSLYATFSGVRHGRQTLATPEQKKLRSESLSPLNKKKAAMDKEKSALEKKIMDQAKSKLTEYEKQWSRPMRDRMGTEERFDPVEAKFIRLISESQDNRIGAVGGFAIDEFEVYSGDRNIALASHGSKASGPARKIEDFPGAYGPHLTIDGKFGARFLAAKNHLTIEFPKVEMVERVFFSSARGEETPNHRKFVFVADYRIEVSRDGKNWKEVAHGRDRKPVNAAHRDYRLLRLERTNEQTRKLNQLNSDINQLNNKIKRVAPLPTAWIGSRNPNDAKGPFHIFLGGSPQKKGDKVVPMSLSPLSKVVSGYRLDEKAAEAKRRKELADWITQPDNPLTWRVLANRLWHYHFGTGIVDTPNDFGFMGGRPTHPELLDYLVGELRKNQFQIKALHKLIMSSDVYMQSSEWDQSSASIDGDSRLLWRFPPRRLSAEEIRDTILKVSGRLNLSMKGPGFRLYKFMQDNVCTYEPLDVHGPETYRRAVYHQNARASVVDLMTEFDQPDCAFSIPRRAATTTPLQALTLLNHSFTLDMATALEDELKKGAGVDDQRLIEELFQRAYQRKPEKAEINQCMKVMQQHGLRALARAVLNSTELIHLD